VHRIVEYSRDRAFKRGRLRCGNANLALPLGSLYTRHGLRLRCGNANLALPLGSLHTRHGPHLCPPPLLAGARTSKRRIKPCVDPVLPAVRRPKPFPPVRKAPRTSAWRHALKPAWPIRANQVNRFDLSDRNGPPVRRLYRFAFLRTRGVRVQHFDDGAQPLLLFVGNGDV